MDLRGRSGVVVLGYGQAVGPGMARSSVEGGIMGRSQPRGSRMAETRVWPDQRAAAQKMGPWGGNNCVSGKVKVTQPWSVTTSDHKQIYMKTMALGASADV